MKNELFYHGTAKAVDSILKLPTKSQRGVGWNKATLGHGIYLTDNVSAALLFSNISLQNNLRNEESLFAGIGEVYSVKISSQANVLDATAKLDAHLIRQFLVDAGVRKLKIDRFNDAYFENIHSVAMLYSTVIPYDQNPYELLTKELGYNALKIEELTWNTWDYYPRHLTVVGSDFAKTPVTLILYQDYLIDEQHREITGKSDKIIIQKYYQEVKNFLSLSENSEGLLENDTTWALKQTAKNIQSLFGDRIHPNELQHYLKIQNTLFLNKPTYGLDNSIEFDLIELFKELNAVGVRVGEYSDKFLNYQTLDIYRQREDLNKNIALTNLLEGELYDITAHEEANKLSQTNMTGFFLNSFPCYDARFHGATLDPSGYDVFQFNYEKKILGVFSYYRKEIKSITKSEKSQEMKEDFSIRQDTLDHLISVGEIPADALYITTEKRIAALARKGQILTFLPDACNDWKIAYGWTGAAHQLIVENFLQIEGKVSITGLNNLRTPFFDGTGALLKVVDWDFMERHHGNPYKAGLDKVIYTIDIKEPALKILEEKNIIIHFSSGDGESFIDRITDLAYNKLDLNAYANWEDFREQMENKYSHAIFLNDHRDGKKYGAIIIEEGKQTEIFLDKEADKYYYKSEELKKKYADQKTDQNLLEESSQSYQNNNTITNKEVKRSIAKAIEVEDHFLVFNHSEIGLASEVYSFPTKEEGHQFLKDNISDHDVFSTVWAISNIEPVQIKLSNEGIENPFSGGVKVLPDLLPVTVDQSAPNPEFEILIISKELEKDGGREHKDRFLIAAENEDSAKDIAEKMWKEQYPLNDLSLSIISITNIHLSNQKTNQMSTQTVTPEKKAVVEKLLTDLGYKGFKPDFLRENLTKAVMEGKDQFSLKSRSWSGAVDFTIIETKNKNGNYQLEVVAFHKEKGEYMSLPVKGSGIFPRTEVIENIMEGRSAEVKKDKWVKEEEKYSGTELVWLAKNGVPCKSLEAARNTPWDHLETAPAKAFTIRESFYEGTITPEMSKIMAKGGKQDIVGSINLETGEIQTVKGAHPDPFSGKMKYDKVEPTGKSISAEELEKVRAKYAKSVAGEKPMQKVAEEIKPAVEEEAKKQKRSRKIA